MSRVHRIICVKSLLVRFSRCEVHFLGGSEGFRALGFVWGSEGFRGLGFGFDCGVRIGTLGFIGALECGV